MFDELIHAVLAQWAHITIAIFAGIGFAKILSVLIPLIPEAYGVYIKWRNSGYRLVDRLEEFLTDQELKISTSRSELANLLQRPPIDHDEMRTAFDEKAVRKIVRKMEWGFGTAAPNDLVGAVTISGKRAALARKQAKEHEERQALAHLLLGAKAAARQTDDPTRRNAARSEALEAFDRALRINPRDADALEYSIMMLLELNEPSVALERLKTLISLRNKEGEGTGLGRAHRLEAMVYENLSPPKNGLAYGALRRAVNELPPGILENGPGLLPRDAERTRGEEGVQSRLDGVGRNRERQA
jgi:tetratricopeptide (TPR) repeat protein